MTKPEEAAPTIVSLSHQISDLEYQTNTVLVLSAINLIANLVTVLAAILVAMW